MAPPDAAHASRAHMPSEPRTSRPAARQADTSTTALSLKPTSSLAPGSSPPVTSLRLLSQPAFNTTQLLALQMSAGNMAVAHAMSKVPAKHPAQARHDAGETGTSATVTPLPVLQMAPKGRDQAANIAKLTQLRANADKQFQLATDYSANTLAVGDAAHTKLQILSNTYSQAYDTFREVLNKAQQAAQNQQMWTDVVLGVICGTAAGLAAAFVLPSTAAGWFSLTLAEAGTAALSSAGQGLLSGGAQALLSKTVGV